MLSGSALQGYIMVLFLLCLIFQFFRTWCHALMDPIPTLVTNCHNTLWTAPIPWYEHMWGTLKATQQFGILSNSLSRLNPLPFQGVGRSPVSGGWEEPYCLFALNCAHCFNPSRSNDIYCTFRSNGGVKILLTNFLLYGWHTDQYSFQNIFYRSEKCIRHCIVMSECQTGNKFRHLMDAI